MTVVVVEDQVVGAAGFFPIDMDFISVHPDVPLSFAASYPKEILFS